MIIDVSCPDWRRLVAKRPGIHSWPPGQLSFFAIGDDVLSYIAAHTGPESNTIETGLGASTIVFACRRSNHICVAPSREEIARLRQFCAEEDVPTDQVQFVPEFSEIALPKLPLPPLDLVLIDGRHGFPAPMLDWYYTSRQLKVGGRLLVDDVHLWPVQMLVEYLSSSPHWELSQVFQQTLSYVRISAGDERAEWIDQHNVQEKTAALQNRLRRELRFRRACQLASRGHLHLLAGKFFRRLSSHLRLSS